MSAIGSAGSYRGETAPLLDARGLDVAIGGRTVCRGLDLAVRPGERLAVLGRNGAGKSTLLATLAGLRSPAAGEIRLGGDPIADLDPRQRALRRGWLAQAQADPFSSTVLETVLTGRHPYLGRWDWESGDDARIARTALADVGLDGFADRPVTTLSGGERQRVAIAALLAQSPPLYLLDEPLTHLDLGHQIAVLDLFAGRARDCGIGCVMVLHDPGLAARYCDRALLLYGDGAADYGAAAELLDGDRLSRLYGYPLRRVEVDGRPVFVPE